MVMLTVSDGREAISEIDGIRAFRLIVSVHRFRCTQTYTGAHTHAYRHMISYSCTYESQEIEIEVEIEMETQHTAHA